MFWEDELRVTLSLYLRLLGMQLRGQLAYRLAFFLDLISTAFIVVAEFASIAVVFERFGTMKGWTLGEVAFLYGMLEFSFGWMDMIFSGFDPSNFGRAVRQGTFDRLLLRPVPLVVQVLGSDLALRRLGKVALGAGIFAFALQQTSIQWTLGKVLFLPFVWLGMICFFGGIFMIGATITFWTVESIEVVNIFSYGGSYVISFPMHIYQRWLRRFFTFVVPAAFLNYYPALYFLGKPDPFGLPPFAPFLAPLVGIAVLGVAHLFWRFGLKHYQSTGS